ncbi:MAG: MATE family efflux transporter [Pseudomonadota bacterium]
MHQRAWPAWMRASELIDLLRLSLPIAITRSAWMLMGITDAVVLGRMAPEELPYVLNSWLPMGVALGFGMGILLGVQVLTSELMGQERSAESGRIFRRGLKFAILLGVVLTLLMYPLAEPMFRALGFAPDVAAAVGSCTRVLSLGLIGFMITAVCSMYLEALRRPLIATLIAYGGVVANVFFNILFVTGVGPFEPMGADGVAWATTATRSLLVIAFMIAVIRLTPAFQSSPDSPSDETKRQFSVGVGTAISNVAEWGGFNFTYVIATWISLQVNTVYGYATQLMGLAFMAFLGIGTATSVRVAEHYGRKDAEGVANASRLGVVATLATGVMLGLLIYVFREPLSLLLVRGDAAMDGILLAPALAALLVTVAFAVVFDGLQATASMALRAQNMIWLPSAIHIGSFFIVMIPMGYWLGLVQGRGAQGMIEAAFIGVFVAGLLQVSLLEYKTARFYPKRAA